VPEILTPAKVSEIFTKCLCTEVNTSEGVVEARGIGVARFYQARLEVNRSEITAMLEELPDDFKAEKGGGATFLNACIDRHGQLWTGMQPTVEQLFLLGIAIGKAKLTLPREVWPSLPGGVPYYTVL